MYFASNRPRGAGRNDIYVSERADKHDDFAWGEPHLPDGTFSTPAAIDELNTLFADRQPVVSRDGREMIFASDRECPGDLDLWVATRTHAWEAWSAPVSLGSAVNTTFVEAGPALAFDGRTLYFHSNRPNGAGAFDLYTLTREK